MYLIDSHCHLYAEEFTLDIEQIIKKATDEGVRSFYLPAIDSTTHTSMIALEKKFHGTCMSMMGLHPCSVKENYREELFLVEDWLSRRRFAAVGEIGLDFYWDKTFIREQYLSFRTQAELAIKYDLPVVIHTRNAMEETINLVKEFTPVGLRGIFHCFGGTLEQANEIINSGYYLGIGGVITYKNAGLAEVISKISLDHIVLETDAPYLSPAPFRGKRNESSYLKLIAEKVADVKKISLNEVAAITTANALRVFSPRYKNSQQMT